MEPAVRFRDGWQRNFFVCEALGGLGRSGRRRIKWGLTRNRDRMTAIRKLFRARKVQFEGVEQACSGSLGSEAAQKPYFYLGRK